MCVTLFFFFFFFQAEDGIRDADVTGVQTCALPISSSTRSKEPCDDPRRDEHLRRDERDRHAPRVRRSRRGREERARHGSEERRALRLLQRAARPTEAPVVGSERLLPAL